MIQVKEINLSHTVELPILSNTSSKISFGDNETALDKVIIHGISIAGQNITRTPSGRLVLPSLDTNKGYLTLSDPGRVEYNAQMPLELFTRYEPVIWIKPKLVSIRNSFVDLPLVGSLVIPAGPPAGYGIVFTFYFDRYDENIHSINALGELVG
jgi:hypothetical protein